MALDSIQCFAGLALTGLFAALQPTDGIQSGPLSIRGVQMGGRALADVVVEHRQRSSTFRKLLRELDASDWIVFVQTGTCRVPGVVGCLLHRIGTAQGRHHLRIVIGDGHRSNDEVITTIGHELHHAVEVISEPGIAAPGDIPQLYRRIGYVSMRMVSGELYETRGAVTAGSDIWREARSARRAAERPRSTSR